MAGQRNLTFYVLGATESAGDSLSRLGCSGPLEVPGVPLKRGLTAFQQCFDPFDRACFRLIYGALHQMVSWNDHRIYLIHGCGDGAGIALIGRSSGLPARCPVIQGIGYRE